MSLPLTLGPPAPLCCHQSKSMELRPQHPKRTSLHHINWQFPVILSMGCKLTFGFAVVSAVFNLPVLSFFTMSLCSFQLRTFSSFVLLLLAFCEYLYSTGFALSLSLSLLGVPFFSRFPSRLQRSFPFLFFLSSFLFRSSFHVGSVFLSSSFHNFVSCFAPGRLKLL